MTYLPGTRQGDCGAHESPKSVRHDDVAVVTVRYLTFPTRHAYETERNALQTLVGVSAGAETQPGVRVESRN